MPANKPGYRPCPIDRAKAFLDMQDPTPRPVSPGRYHDLHPDGQRLISTWIGRAEDATTGGEEFEAFIFAWISFNGWATCCCAEEGDKHQLQMMMLDSRLTRRFATLMKDSDFRNSAQTFSSFWPIFRVSHLPQNVRLDRPRHGGRKAVTDHYHHHCPKAERAPDCHLTHPSSIEPDWAHTLEALYRVRNNLFHGQKSSAGHEDHMIVQAAVGVLVPMAASVLTLR